MTDTVFNVAKGKVAYYATLPATNDAFTVIPLETAGLEADSVLQDYATLNAILTAASNEQATMGRKSVTTTGAGGVTVTVDTGNNRVDVDMPDVLWPTASGNAISRLVVAYEPDTTVGAGAIGAGTARDLAAIPLVLLDAVATPSGGDITYTVNAAGFYRAS